MPPPAAKNQGNHRKDLAASLPTEWARERILPGFQANAARLWSLRDAVLAHLRVERRAAEAEHGGGGLLVPAGRFQRLDDGGALDLLERARGDVGRGHARLHLAVVLLEHLRQIGNRDRAGA